VDLTALESKRKRALPKIDRRFAIGGLAGGVLTAVLGVGTFFIVQPDNEESAEPARFASTATQRRVDTEPVAAVPRQSASAADTAAAAPTAPVSAAAQQLQADEQAGDELSPTQLELIRMQQDMTGTLAWSQLTSGIVRGEPVDNLGWIVEVADKPMRVFFFVRVRGMSGATVQYHWHHEGELIKQDSVRVGDGWHSPAFSSVILDSAREGQWRVEVLDEAGQSLGAEQFEARSPGTAVLSQR
ncbi:MAG: DUF2914 domain-containing protein, partial [Gammaproteobacteria bacterium]|nr:DUF2914 domain-containing protein [Gammaproteobacteria bacterium]